MNNELTRLRKRRASLDRAIQALEQLEKLATGGTHCERIAGQPQPRRIQQEQAELQRQLAEQKRKQEEAARQAEAERPEVKPLPSTSMSQKALADPASMLKEPGSVLAKRSVYYDFDAFNIKEEFQITVEAHAKFLLEHKDFKVRIEGYRVFRLCQSQSVVCAQRADLESRDRQLKIIDRACR